TVRFGNDQFASILGYGDLVQGNITINKRSLGKRNLQALVISVRTDRGTEFLNKTLHVFFKEEGIKHQSSTPRTPKQNGVVERQNRTLVAIQQLHHNKSWIIFSVLCTMNFSLDNSNMHTFYQPHDSEYRWTKDHPLEQVHGNPSKPVQTRRQLATDLEMCMFTLTMITAEPKTIKEAMANSAWIEAMQEELHQFDRLQVWELIDKPFAKGYAQEEGIDFKESFAPIARLGAV
nr:hypothetical protein [Tanacetum cinerariifolium]